MPLRVREKETKLSAEVARSLLSYDPLTGFMTWKVHGHKIAPGKVAGSKNVDGYGRVTVLGHSYMSIHLIWLLETGEWPVHGVDHKDRDATNDRWENLRAATYTQNNHNLGLRKDNRTGVKGVSFVERNTQNPFSAKITANGAVMRLGFYPSLEEAASVRAAAELKYHGEFSPLYEVS